VFVALPFAYFRRRYSTEQLGAPLTFVLGGVTYACLHVFDGWTDFASPADAVLSLAYLLLFCTGPGMFKTYLTVRTGNAWVHVRAYQRSRRTC
jgi:hypothetical protein